MKLFKTLYHLLNAWFDARGATTTLSIREKAIEYFAARTQLTSGYTLEDMLNINLASLGYEGTLGDKLNAFMLAENGSVTDDPVEAAKVFFASDTTQFPASIFIQSPSSVRYKLPSGVNVLDIQTTADITIEFGDDTVTADGNSALYPASSFGDEAIGVPATATHVAFLAVSDLTNVLIRTSTSSLFLGANKSLEFDAEAVPYYSGGTANAFYLDLATAIAAPFTVICKARFIEGRTNVLMVAGQSTPVANTHIFGLRTSTGGQVGFWHRGDGEASTGTITPVWSAVASTVGEWGIAAAACITATDSRKTWSGISGTDNTSATNTTELTTASATYDRIVIGASHDGAQNTTGEIEWGMVIGHELTSDEWDTIKGIVVSSPTAPVDPYAQFSDVLFYAPIQDDAPLKDVVSGSTLSVLEGSAVEKDPDFATPTVMSARWGDTILVNYTALVATTAVQLPTSNCGQWRIASTVAVRAEVGDNTVVATGGSEAYNSHTGPKLLPSRDATNDYVSLITAQDGYATITAYNQ